MKLVSLSFINFLPSGPNGKIVLIRFVHVFKKYKTRVGDRQRNSGILAQKVSTCPSVHAPVFYDYNYRFY